MHNGVYPLQGPYFSAIHLNIKKRSLRVPAATIRQIAKEFGEAAHIGETIEVGGVTMPYRPVCVDLFSGLTRHKHAYHACWSVIMLNVIVGAANSVGGLIGFDPACNGITVTLRTLFSSVPQFGRKTAS